MTQDIRILQVMYFARRLIDPARAARCMGRLFAVNCSRKRAGLHSGACCRSGGACQLRHYCSGPGGGGDGLQVEEQGPGRRSQLGQQGEEDRPAVQEEGDAHGAERGRSGGQESGWRLPGAAGEGQPQRRAADRGHVGPDQGRWPGQGDAGRLGGQEALACRGWRRQVGATHPVPARLHAEWRAAETQARRAREARAGALPARRLHVPNWSP